MLLMPIAPYVTIESFDALIAGYLAATGDSFVIINNYQEFLNAISSGVCNDRVVIIEDIESICEKLKWEKPFQRIQFMLASQQAKVLIYRGE